LRLFLLRKMYKVHTKWHWRIIFSSNRYATAWIESTALKKYRIDENYFDYFSCSARDTFSNVSKYKIYSLSDNNLTSLFFFRVSAPNSPLHRSNRAHVLLLLNRPLAALTDADHAVRLRPDWGKVRKHRTYLPIISACVR